MGKIPRNLPQHRFVPFKFAMLNLMSQFVTAVNG